MTPKILLALFGLAVLAGCDDSASSSKEDYTPKTWATGNGEVVFITGTFNSSFLEKTSGFTYREQITFTGEGAFEFVDYETLDATGKITSYTTFLGKWRMPNSTITLYKNRRIYHTTLSGETNTDSTIDPPSEVVFGTNYRVTSDTSFTLDMPDGARLTFTKAPKLQFAF